MYVNTALEDFGLSNKEIKVYLAALEMGTATANELSKKSGLNRSTVYDLLKALVEKGISSTVIKNNASYFEVVEPERLVSILEEKKKKISL